MSKPPTDTLTPLFTYALAAALVTSTDTVQLEAPAAAFTPPPPMVKVPVPAVAVMVGAPPQLFTTFGTAAITTPAGSASLKVRFARAGEPTGLVMVKVSVLGWLTPIVEGTNALVSDGSGCTVSDDAVTLFVMRAVPPMLAALFVYGPPTTLEVTSTVTAHDATAAFMAAPVTVMVPLPAAAVTNAGAAAKPAPAGQLLVTFGVAATTTFAGNVSVKLMPDCAGLPAPFVMVNVRVDVPPWLIVVGANALLSEACTTVSVWLVTPLVSTPPTVMLAAPLVYTAAALLVTSTLTVQVLAPTAAFTPVPPMVKVPVPAVAVMVGAPPQLFTTFGTAAITTPAGSASLKVRFARAGEPTGLVMVKVSVLGWLTPIVEGTNALVSDGSGCTVSDDAVTLFVMRAVPPMLAALFVYGPPTTLEVTSTVTAHDATAPFIAAPVTVMVPLPAAAVTNAGPAAKPAPAGQLLVTFGVAATTTLAGSVSVKLMPACDGLPAPLVSVKVRVDVPPTLMVVGANALLSDACVTVSVWLVTPLVSTPPTDTLPAPLVYAFAALLVTSTLTVQLLGPTAEFTPVPPTVKVPAPATAVMVGAAPQLFTAFGTAAITSPAGSVSVKVRPVRAGAPPGFAIVKVSVPTWPTPRVAGA